MFTFSTTTNRPNYFSTPRMFKLEKCLVFEKKRMEILQDSTLLRFKKKKLISLMHINFLISVFIPGGGSPSTLSVSETKSWWFEKFIKCSITQWDCAISRHFQIQLSEFNLTFAYVFSVGASWHFGSSFESHV